MRLLTPTVLFALAAVSLTSIARAFPCIAKAAERGVKPWGCDVCMAFWAIALAALAVCFIDWHLAFAALPAHGLAVVVLRVIRPPPSLADFKEPNP